MTRVLSVLPEQLAFRQFAQAVLAFSDDPGPENLEHYLEASRTLEDSRGSHQPLHGGPGGMQLSNHDRPRGDLP